MLNTTYCELVKLAPKLDIDPMGPKGGIDLLFVAGKGDDVDIAVSLSHSDQRVRFDVYGETVRGRGKYFGSLTVPMTDKSPRSVANSVLNMSKKIWLAFRPYVRETAIDRDKLWKRYLQSLPSQMALGMTGAKYEFNLAELITFRDRSIAA